MVLVCTWILYHIFVNQSKYIYVVPCVVKESEALVASVFSQNRLGVDRKPKVYSVLVLKKLYRAVQKLSVPFRPSRFFVVFAKLPDQLFTRIAVNKSSANIRT